MTGTIFIYVAILGVLIVWLCLAFLLVRLARKQARTHALAKDLYTSLQTIKQNQENMATQNEQIKAKLDTISTTLDNIQTDNAEQTALITELKTKLEEQGVSQETLDLLDQIEQKASNIAAEWPTDQPNEEETPA